MAEEDFEIVYKKARKKVLHGEKSLQKAGVYHGWPLLDKEKELDYAKSYEFMNKFVAQEPGLDSSGTNSDSDKVRASWEASRPWRGKHGMVTILENKDGRVRKVFTPVPDPANARLVFFSRTMVARTGSSMREAEEAAMKKLRSIISFFQWHCYVVEGAFLEDGKSGVTYCFRKGRPTLAFRKDRFLCALCLHPLAYYAGTWAGAMCPTDEIVAHLLMARKDEKFFWRKANQIPLEDCRSGI